MIPRIRIGNDVDEIMVGEGEALIAERELDLPNIEHLKDYSPRFPNLYQESL